MVVVFTIQAQIHYPSWPIFFWQTSKNMLGVACITISAYGRGLSTINLNWTGFQNVLKQSILWTGSSRFFIGLRSAHLSITPGRFCCFVENLFPTVVAGLTCKICGVWWFLARPGPFSPDLVNNIFSCLDFRAEIMCFKVTSVISCVCNAWALQGCCLRHSAACLATSKSLSFLDKATVPWLPVLPNKHGVTLTRIALVACRNSELVNNKIVGMQTPWFRSTRNDTVKACEVKKLKCRGYLT